MSSSAPRRWRRGGSTHLRAEDAFTQLRDRQLDLSIGRRTASRSLKGADAVSRPLLTEWGKRFQDVETEIAGTLSNDEQRQLFKKRADVSRLQFNEEILRHLAREGDTYAKEVYDGTLPPSSATRWRAGTARTTSSSRSPASTRRSTSAPSATAGRPSTATPCSQQEAGKVHASVVQQAIASGDYKYAQEWFNEHKADIDLPTAKLLEKAVEDGTQKELANGYRAEYLANESSPKALEGLRKRVLGRQDLDDGRRNVLVGTIQNQQFRLERRRDAEHDRVMRTLERGINELNSNTLAGFEPTPTSSPPTSPQRRAPSSSRSSRRPSALANATRMFRNQPPTVQERLLSEAEAGVRRTRRSSTARWWAPGARSTRPSSAR
jgi:hypothetical protein